MPSRLPLLRLLSGYTLPCGCLMGVYAAYADEVIDVIEIRADACPDESHRPGTQLPRPAPPQTA